MIRQILLAAITFGAVAALDSSEANANTLCIRPVEESADKVRFVQTHFMVAALQCRYDSSSKLPELYNDFVRGHDIHLKNSEAPLRAFLKRQGEQTLDTYMVTIANKVSLQSTKLTEFCDRTEAAAELSNHASSPEALLELMPVRYQRPAARCISEPVSLRY
ncbi:hypothetical protein [Kordiimonas sp. SCSIO 12610]|uniref:hypothetical protein n=1 Tax=Kordiimonas sp. SCSIO 12610 TaxID=2829597 RepID=UPI00210CA8EA|nr:hypothetical protein [Kordiimonas sp. SCSIO 12610]UTW56637.1 hypothetical protein KFF44_07015 [Kordiimonas sp. SCSIO 12610]